MPVDEDNLAKIISDVGAKLDEVTTQRSNLKIILSNANSIRQVEVPDPTEENPGQRKMVMPNDRSLGNKIKPARRQEIYDQIVSDAVGLLA